MRTCRIPMLGNRFFEWSKIAPCDNDNAFLRTALLSTPYGVSFFFLVPPLFMGRRNFVSLCPPYTYMRTREQMRHLPNPTSTRHCRTYHGTPIYNLGINPRFWILVGACDPCRQCWEFPSSRRATIHVTKQSRRIFALCGWLGGVRDYAWGAPDVGVYWYWNKYVNGEIRSFFFTMIHSMSAYRY